jgi:hypothetical protein
VTAAAAVADMGLRALLVATDSELEAGADGLPGNIAYEQRE